MKNDLLYNYDIDIEHLNEFEGGAYFYLNDVKYYFVKCNRAAEDVNMLYRFLKGVINQYHEIVVNKFGQIFTSENYVLLIIKGGEMLDVDLIDIVNNHIEIVGNLSLGRYNWALLWGEKVDYLEYQVSELAGKYKIVRSSFSYYAGLAENAIEYFNMVDKSGMKVYLQQKKIYYKNKMINYYNPLGLVADYSVREMAEYIKACFFNGEEIFDEICRVVNLSFLSESEYNLLFCRLLYPNYYFDEIGKIFEEKKEEEQILKYISKVADYEKFLGDVFQLFSGKCRMIELDWLIKRL